MKMLEIRRHSLTKKGPERGSGSSLSQEGVDLARSVGTHLPRFDRVVASDIPRSAETAIAMGFAVDELIADLCPSDPELYAEIGHHERWSWEFPFQRFAEFVARGGPTARLGKIQVDLWLQVFSCIPEGGYALVISHGRVIESGLVMMFADGDFQRWGAPFSHCEGARVALHAGRPPTLEVVRVDP